MYVFRVSLGNRACVFLGEPGEQGMWVFRVRLRSRASVYFSMKLGNEARVFTVSLGNRAFVFSSEVGEGEVGEQRLCVFWG